MTRDPAGARSASGRVVIGSARREHDEMWFPGCPEPPSAAGFALAPAAARGISVLEGGLTCLAEGVHAERGFRFELEDGDEPAHHAEAADGQQEFDDLAGREVLAQAGERLAGDARRVECLGGEGEYGALSVAEQAG